MKAITQATQHCQGSRDRLGQEELDEDHVVADHRDHDHLRDWLDRDW